VTEAIPPWEAEQAAEALAEAKQASEMADRERAALRTVEGQLLVQQVDRMIEDRKSELLRMEQNKTVNRFLPGSHYAHSALLNIVTGKPSLAIAVLAMLIVFILALSLLGMWFNHRLAEIPEQPAAETTYEP
jgi:hypothetical protein